MVPDVINGELLQKRQVPHHCVSPLNSNAQRSERLQVGEEVLREGAESQSFERGREAGLDLRSRSFVKLNGVQVLERSDFFL